MCFEIGIGWLEYVFGMFHNERLGFRVVRGNIPS